MRPSFLPRCRRRLASTVCTCDSLPNWKRITSPGFAPTAALIASRASFAIDLASGLCVQFPCSSTLARASPFAPIPLAISSSLSVSVRDSPALAGTTTALTIWPAAGRAKLDHMGMPAPPCSATMRVKSTCFMPKRRSGLSFPYSRIDCSYGMRKNGFLISTPSASRHSAVTSSSTTVNTSSCDTNDISRSICVNSGCRSRRRSSSRKHFTIWK